MGRTVNLLLAIAAGLALFMLAGCEGGDDFKADTGPPPKITEEDRARMEGISLEEYRRQAALKQGTGQGK